MTATAFPRVEIPRKFAFLLDPPLGSVRYRGAYGGRGSAKSWQVARTLLLLGANQKLRNLCAREFQSSIKDSVHRLLSDQIALLGLEAWYEVQRDAILGRNGTEFLFKGLRRDIAEIKSMEGVDICWVEEAEAVSETHWGVLIPTIRKEGSEIWFTFNPALATDSTYKRFVVNPPPDSLIHFVSYRDNPWFPEVLRKEAEELKKRDPEAYAHIWEGGVWQRSKSGVLTDKCVVLEFTPEAHWQGPYFGLDFGFSQDPSVLVKCWVADNRLYLEQEAGGVQLDTNHLRRAIRTIEGTDRYIIRGDAARPETINELRLPWPDPATGDTIAGLNVVAAPKWSGSVEDGIAHLRNYEQIVIHSRCKRAQEEARLYRYKVDPRTDDVLPDLVDAFNHVWDAVRYALAPLIRTRPGPRILTYG